MKFLVKVSPSIPPTIAEMDRLPRVGDVIFEKYVVISVKPPRPGGVTKRLPVVSVVLKQRLKDAG